MGNDDFVKSQLLKFANKYLDGKFENLATFRIVTLRDDKELGSPDSRFDPDDTNLMRLICMALFSEAWPDMTWESLEKQVFRGDTLNTYNTFIKALHEYIDNYNNINHGKKERARYNTELFLLLDNV